MRTLLLSACIPPLVKEPCRDGIHIVVDGKRPNIFGKLKGRMLSLHAAAQKVDLPALKKTEGHSPHTSSRRFHLERWVIFKKMLSLFFITSTNTAPKCSVLLSNHPSTTQESSPSNIDPCQPNHLIDPRQDSQETFPARQPPKPFQHNQQKRCRQGEQLSHKTRQRYTHTILRHLPQGRGPRRRHDLRIPPYTKTPRNLMYTVST